MATNSESKKHSLDGFLPQADMQYIDQIRGSELRKYKELLFDAERDGFSNQLEYIGDMPFRTSREVKASRLGVGLEVLDHREAYDFDQTLKFIRNSGVKWARLQTGWQRAEKIPGVYDFKWLDHIVDSLLEAGIAPWMSLSFGNGLYMDLFMSNFATNHGDASSWFHVGRYPGHSILFDWRDAALPTSGGRVYLAADATRDTDGDGLPDEMERRVYGTSPYLSDTDGDGLSDNFELAWGFNPIAADHASAVSFFSEPFEPPNVVAGPIEGQNGWTAGQRPASAVAQGEVVYEGIGALELSGGTATHSVTCSAQVVWVDQRVHSECGVAEADVPQDVTAFFYFDVAGHPVMSDGGLLFTNLAYSVIGWRRWTRCTMRFDYTSRTWDMYVDGVIVGEGLSMCGDATSFGSIEMSGVGVVDNLLVTTERPLGLSSDGDALPDEWEIEHFGELSHDGSEDSDGDGMSDLVEFRAGTDPLAHNGDTDGDGLPDWWEAANGRAALPSSPAAA